MNDWEKIVDHEIKFWYESIGCRSMPWRAAKYFDQKPWQHLFDEEKQMLAEMYWEDQLS